MFNLNSLKRFAFYLYFLFVLFISHIVFAAAPVAITQNQFNNLYVNVTAQPDVQYCQTLAHLAHPNLKNFQLDDCPNTWDHTVYKTKIDQIGRPALEKIMNKVIAKEIELQDDYYVFYHGQKREFLAMQNLFESLYEFFYKKAFIDFLMLRVPEEEHYKYKVLDKFFNAFGRMFHDGQENIRKLLLSVNPSLFGNTYSKTDGGLSSTLYYFITSGNANYTDFSKYSKQVFSFFKISSDFDKYKKDLDKLFQILSEDEKTKSGLIIQIFVPKKVVNDIVYRAYAGGTPFYGANLFASTTAQVLDNYRKQILAKDIYTLDTAQFRILLNKETMLNAESGVKIFRYYNKTENTKKYDNLFKKFMDKMIQDLQDKTANKNNLWHKKITKFLSFKK